MTTTSTSIQAEDQSLDRELDFGRLAEQLAALSESCPLPAGAVPAEEPTPFQAEDVDFQTNDWLQKLLSVQCWIRLDSMLRTDQAPLDLATRLYAELAPDKPESCFQTDAGGNILLTALGVQALEARLSRAQEYKQAFNEAIDEDRSPKDASAEWLANWEENESAHRPPMSITARVDQWRLKEFKEYAKEGLLDLNPSYQRDIVWSTTESQMLIESILRGIPLPSVILSETQGRRWQIVDGKQRLTAILRFIGAHPDGRAYAESKSDIDTFEKNFRKFARNHHLKPAEIGERFLPFKLKTFEPIDPLFKFSGKYYYEIKDMTLPFGGEHPTVREIFESIGSSYQVPVLLYKNTKIQDIHHVFGLYNKQGKKLNAEEVRNAVYHHVALMRLLLVLSGDRPSADDLAPYLPESRRAGIRQLGGLLKDYNFGIARFKRTKVLSWVSGILLQEPNEVAGQLATPSTAAHINAMLEAGEKRPKDHPLGTNSGLIEFARVTEVALNLHVENDIAWAPKFKNKKGNGSKWEELPLVGSLLACMTIVAVDRQADFSNFAADIRELSEGLKSPEKTQNRTQWQHIAKVALAILDKCNIDLPTAGEALHRKFGYNCIPTLQKLRT